MHPASFPSSSPLRSPRALYKHPNAAPQLAGLTPEGVRQWQTDERHAHESGLVTMDEGGLEVFWATKVNAENGLCPAAWTRRPPPPNRGMLVDIVGLDGEEERICRGGRLEIIRLA